MCQDSNQKPDEKRIIYVEDSADKLEQSSDQWGNPPRPPRNPDPVSDGTDSAPTGPSEQGGEESDQQGRNEE